VLEKKKEEKRPVVDRVILDRGIFIDRAWVGDEASN